MYTINNKTEKTFSLKRLRNSENSQIREFCIDLHKLAQHHMATKRLALCFYDDIKVKNQNLNDHQYYFKEKRELH